MTTENTAVLSDSFIQKLTSLFPNGVPPENWTFPEAAKFIASNGTKEQRGQLFENLFAEQTSASPSGNRISFGTLALLLGGGIVAASLIYGIFVSPTFVSSLANEKYSRGLITFLFAFGTISMMVIIGIAALWADFDQIEKRIGLAKDILMLLIGILGTILGFYFGTAQAVLPPH